MNHIHRVHYSGGYFIVSCNFAKQAEAAMETGWPKLIKGDKQGERQGGSLVVATKDIIAVELEKGHGAEAEDSCSHNR